MVAFFGVDFWAVRSLDFSRCLSGLFSADFLGGDFALSFGVALTGSTGLLVSGSLGASLRGWATLTTTVGCSVGLGASCLASLRAPA